MSKINEQIRTLTDSLKQAIVDAGGINKILSESGTVSKDIFNKILPQINEDVTPEQVEAVSNVISTYGTAATLATGELATEAAKADKELKSVSLVYGLTGDDVVNVDWQRNKEGRNPKTGETKTNHGATRTGFDIYQMGPNRGQMAAVRGHLLELGAAELGE